MDIFGQKLPLNGMIRAKERWCFGTLLHVYVSFLFLHQTTKLIKYTTNVMIDVVKRVEETNSLESAFLVLFEVVLRNQSKYVHDVSVLYIS